MLAYTYMYVHTIPNSLILKTLFQKKETFYALTPTACTHCSCYMCSAFDAQNGGTGETNTIMTSHEEHL